MHGLTARGVIADELYVQVVNRWGRSRFTSTNRRETRRLLSELLLFIQPSNREPWIAFRDVFEVDGAPVKDRQNRLEELFRESPEVSGEF